MDNSVAPLQCLLTFSGHLSHSKMHNLIALLPLLQPCGPKPPITPPKPLELRKNQGRRPPPLPSTMEFAISVESWSNLPPSLCLSHSFDSTTWKLKLFGKCQSQLIIATEAASTTSPCCSTICSQPLVLVPTSEFPFPPFFCAISAIPLIPVASSHDFTGFTPFTPVRHLSSSLRSGAPVHNGICLKSEMQWRNMKRESFSGASQIWPLSSGIYLINSSLTGWLACCSCYMCCLNMKEVRSRDGCLL